MNELEVARQIATGSLPSPSVFAGNTYFAMRVSGTGVAWREATQEYAHRSADIWLSDEMRRRVAGVPLIAEHPTDGTLDGDEFVCRVLGILTLGFVRDTELWGIARIIDPRAAELINSGNFDTSPSVMLETPENAFITLPEGDRLLVEGAPIFFDHLALIDTSGGNGGVWSKGDNATAVETERTEND